MESVQIPIISGLSVDNGRIDGKTSWIRLFLIMKWDEALIDKEGDTLYHG